MKVCSITCKYNCVTQLITPNNISYKAFDSASIIQYLLQLCSFRKLLIASVERLPSQKFNCWSLESNISVATISGSYKWLPEP